MIDYLRSVTAVAPSSKAVKPIIRREESAPGFFPRIFITASLLKSSAHIIILHQLYVHRGA
jgi:hypothetical protein